jgi:hypothetical protein
MSSIEAGRPNEHGSESHARNRLELSSAMRPPSNGVGASSSEITNPIAYDEAEIRQPKPHHSDHDPARRSILIGSGLIAGVGVVTIAGVVALGVTGEKPQHETPTAPASTSASQAPKPGKTTLKPKASETQSAKATEKNANENGTSKAEKATQIVAKDVGRLTTSAEELQTGTHIFGIDIGTGCLEGTEYAQKHDC